MSEKFRCPWCAKDRTKWSDWEQETLGLFGKPPEWKRMCTYCARRRLNNPYNAMLGMRRVEGREDRP